MIRDLEDVGVNFYDIAEYNYQIAELIKEGYSYEEAHGLVQAREAHDAREYDLWLERLNIKYVVE